MPSNGTTENEIAEAVLKILSTHSAGEAKLAYLRKRLPDYISLTAADLQPSTTRPNERMWEQKLRNIKSHAKTSGNYIFEGYLTAPSKGILRITEAGKRRAT